MSATSSPVESKLPTRSNTLRTVSTGTYRRASMSDDEAIPGSDSNEVCTRKNPNNTSWIMLTLHIGSIDYQPPRRASSCLEAHVRILGRLRLCDCPGAEGNVEGL